ncbi:imidazole glycerol phosphate synthase subunit HisH [Parasporobacterium paucivorans]|uniref:Imidazole glycerol phosphate synthase subunit HisH n=1 Tax=Parasporobacterium paucivorans DSM 15970 TaxID=1122934 RepID=A0A1M6AFM8_9FIRM|nr:imidazole glycerol phosphate synthase subunit HisH [Parasporobacterium paucivorans]SHI35217.1 glutamine amidotransferase [Parasporobacterium paucivorans DSM 15970]
MIAIIDYDAGNMYNVEKAFEYIGGEKVVPTMDRDLILSADKVVLPGVGSFGDAMQKLKKNGLAGTIHEVVEKKTPFLGICLGLQLLFESSEESEGVMGLGVLKGKILKIPPAEGLKIPHIGWNSLDFRKNGRLFEGMEANPYVYFVHSYYLKAEEEEIITATTDYGVCIHSSVEKDNIFGCQFHPEKSGNTGIQILRNFVKLGREEK